jgi:nicotinic acid mononucleotide adenylyltransferase
MIYKQQRAQMSERAQQRMPRLKIEDLKENKNNVYTLRD